MKANFIKASIAVLAVTLLAAAALSETQGHRHWHRGGMWGGPGMNLRALDLSDAQKAQVKDIMAKERPALRPLMQQLAQSRMQLQQYQVSGNFDENQVRTMAAQQAQLMTELTVQRARIQSEVIKVLTPEQKTKLATLQSERAQRFQQRMQRQQQAPNSDAAPSDQPQQ